MHFLYRCVNSNIRHLTQHDFRHGRASAGKVCALHEEVRLEHLFTLENLLQVSTDVVHQVIGYGRIKSALSTFSVDVILNLHRGLLTLRLASLSLF